MHCTSKMVRHHTSHDALDLSRDSFGENRIGKYSPENWPARSPDFTPLVFIVLRYVKDREFKTPVNNLTQLKRRITRAIRSITQEFIDRVWKNLENRLYAIIRENGGHLEHF